MPRPSSKPQNVQTSTSELTPRQQAFFTALDNINRKHGEGSVMRMSDRPSFVPSTPSGSLALDIATNIGGIPKGCVTEIYGAESSGKCYSADTFLLTENGMITARELWEQAGYQANCISRIEEYHVGLINEMGEIEKTSHLTWNGLQPVKKIRTSAGLNLEITHNHPIRIMNKDGYIVWKQAGEIQVDDYVVVMRGTEQFGTDNLSVDEATLIGYLIADGSLSQSHQVAFSNSDQEVIESYYRIIGQMTDNPVHAYARTTSIGISHNVYSTEFRRILCDRYGLDYKVAAGKTVPLRVRMSNREAQIAFLRAYVELECSIEPSKSTIEVSSASVELLRQVQLMLLNLGIMSRLSKKSVKGYDQMYYRLSWSGRDYQLYGDIIGFSTSARQKRYAERSVHQIQTNVDSIPHMGNILRSLYDGVDTDREGKSLFWDYMGSTPNARLTYDRLERMLIYLDGVDRKVGYHQQPLISYLQSLKEQHYFFDPVVIIEDDEMPTFDVVMPETHSFWSNGLVSHNTTLALSAIASAQKEARRLHAEWNAMSSAEQAKVRSTWEATTKRDKLFEPDPPPIASCVYIDMEHALNVEWAQRIGVNIDEMYIAQPDTAEQALDIAEAVVRSGGADIVVVDSVDALVTKSQIEGEIGDQTMGIIARFMGTVLRKLNGAISTTRTTFIFINQIRDAIGTIGYGAKTSTSGGRALKFYAHMRLSVTKIQTIKEKDRAVGSRIKIEVTKNKKAAPFRSAETAIYFYEHGISLEEEILDLGEEPGLIDKRGAFYRLAKDGSLLGQGKAAARETLHNNPELRDRLAQEIRNFYLYGEMADTGSPSEDDPEEAAYMSQIQDPYSN